MGVVVMEKQEASKLVTHHHFAPHFFPTPFFSLSPFLPLPFFPLFQNSKHNGLSNLFLQNTHTLLKTKLKLKEKTIQNERTQANLSASLFPDNSPTYNPLSHTPVVFWLSAYIFPEKSNYSFSHSYSTKPYKLSTNKQTQQPSCAITLHTFPSGCHLNTQNHKHTIQCTHHKQGTNSTNCTHPIPSSTCHKHRFWLKRLSAIICHMVASHHLLSSNTVMPLI